MRKLKASIYPNQVEKAIVSNLQKGRMTLLNLHDSLGRLFTIKTNADIQGPIDSLIDQKLIRRVETGGAHSAYEVIG